MVIEMADFASTNRTASFEEWHEQLMDYAELRGGSASDADAWREDYDSGRSVADAWHDAWGDD
ncbi:hypothetical protein DK690_07350 [Salmonella enterica subsp. enterica serovar Richmond]|nr:hypothetical protein [Salmonella enterica subsp. enterica serovar Hessarek]EAA3901415.1 hypothetical protein [Salmonella enterica subsp. enterica serovar Newport]EAC1017811.1 hypothetical protein [Salmonella enterica subsp. enterica serovar Typhimurium]EAQ8070309.1 hypothetical protein [Salmonella enterica]EBQ9089640.1 hypothetical protein [Salmonella enterica subsp. enterica serovar Richmond]EBV2746540.1 hypothetical protein [Salmonella enterica subsp. enterica serovar Java]EBV3791812.1 h